MQKLSSGGRGGFAPSSSDARHPPCPDGETASRNQRHTRGEAKASLRGGGKQSGRITDRQGRGTGTHTDTGTGNLGRAGPHRMRKGDAVRGRRSGRSGRGGEETGGEGLGKARGRRRRREELPKVAKHGYFRLRSRARGRWPGGGSVRRRRPKRRRRKRASPAGLGVRAEVRRAAAGAGAGETAQRRAPDPQGVPGAPEVVAEPPTGLRSPSSGAAGRRGAATGGHAAAWSRFLGAPPSVERLRGSDPVLRARAPVAFQRGETSLPAAREPPFPAAHHAFLQDFTARYHESAGPRPRVGRSGQVPSGKKFCCPRPSGDGEETVYCFMAASRRAEGLLSAATVSPRRTRSAAWPRSPASRSRASQQLVQEPTTARLTGGVRRRARKEVRGSGCQSGFPGTYPARRPLSSDTSPPCSHPQAPAEPREESAWINASTAPPSTLTPPSQRLGRPALYSTWASSQIPLRARG